MERLLPWADQTLQRCEVLQHRVHLLAVGVFFNAVISVAMDTRSHSNNVQGPTSVKCFKSAVVSILPSLNNGNKLTSAIPIAS